jgi:hypothetical protein
LANDREAAFAITALAKFWTAVITSSSACVAGGRSLYSLSSRAGGGSHGGIYSTVHAKLERVHRPLTDMNFSKFTGMQSPVGKPNGERVASQ